MGVGKGTGLEGGRHVGWVWELVMEGLTPEGVSYRWLGSDWLRV